MANIASQICQANGLDSSGGGPISIIPSQIEDLAELPAEKVPDGLPHLHKTFGMTSWLLWHLMFYIVHVFSC